MDKLVETIQDKNLATIADKVACNIPVDWEDARYLFTTDNILDLGTNDGLIRKAGSFYSYGDVRLGQGREAAKDYLRQHQELAAEMEGLIRAAAKGQPTPVAVGLLEADGNEETEEV